MKIEFTGKPKAIAREMRRFIRAVAEGHFEKPVVVNTMPTIPSDAAERVVELAKKTITADPLPDASGLGRATGGTFSTNEPTGNEPPQKSEEPVCQFCERYSNGSAKRVARHEMYCESNPNSVPHPLANRKVHPGLLRYQEERRRLKDLKSSQPETSSESSGSCASETPSPVTEDTSEHLRSTPEISTIETIDRMRTRALRLKGEGVVLPEASTNQGGGFPHDFPF